MRCPMCGKDDCKFVIGTRVNYTAKGNQYIERVCMCKTLAAKNDPGAYWIPAIMMDENLKRYKEADNNENA